MADYSCSLASATQLPAGAYTNVVAAYSSRGSSNTSFTYNASTSSPLGLTVSPASTSSNNLKIQLSSPGLHRGIGGLYEIRVTNEAATATTGTLTVTDALPTGLSYRGARGRCRRAGIAQRRAAPLPARPRRPSGLTA